MTQRQLAGDRYTAAYISALEVGLVRPSWAALTYLSGRLGLALHDLVREAQPGWDRLTADLHLAAGDWQTAADRYTQLLETASGTDASLIRSGRAEALAVSAVRATRSPMPPRPTSSSPRPGSRSRLPTPATGSPTRTTS